MGPSINTVLAGEERLLRNYDFSTRHFFFFLNEMLLVGSEYHLMRDKINGRQPSSSLR